MHHRHLLAPVLALLLAAACAPTPAPSARAEAAAAPAGSPPAAPVTVPPVEALVTLQDVMVNVVDVSADALWEATGTITTAQGTVRRMPRTDAEWNALRRHAVVLLEATNLLVIPDRKVAAIGFASDGPGVLSSDQIQQQIDAHRDQFDGFALGLRAVARQQLEAIDARDADGLLRLGDAMDSACEACHLATWYPNETVPPLPDNPPPPPASLR